MESLLDAMVGFEGRISRGMFWLTLVTLLVPSTIIYLACLHRFSAGRWTAPDFGATRADTWANGLALLVLLLVLMYPSLAISTKRLHDLDLSGWWNLAYFAPSILDAFGRLSRRYGTEKQRAALGTALNWLMLATAILYTIHLGVMPGTPGPNAYGPDPLMR